MMEDVQMMGSMVIMIIYYKKNQCHRHGRWWKKSEGDGGRVIIRWRGTKVEGCKMPAIKQEGWRWSKGKQKSQRQGQSVEVYCKAKLKESKKKKKRYNVLLKHYWRQLLKLGGF
jgi:hypothetical protein